MKQVLPQSRGAQIIAAATAVGNYVAPSDMSSLAPSQLNNGNGRSFFIEIGADLTADLPPISGDPAAGGGLQTGTNDQQKVLAPTYTISTAHIKEQVGCLDKSKFYTSWKIALDTAYIQRDTTLAPDATTYPTNPNRSSLATKPDPVYLCSEQLQNATGNSRYFTRFGQAEITEGLYTTAYARFNRDLPSSISFQFPCALDIIPDNTIKYYANSPRIAGTRDLSNGRPMAAPYYENQFITRFNIRFIVTVEVGLNAQPVYGRLRSAEEGAHVSGTTPGLTFSGPGEAPAGGAVSANVESAQTGFDRIAEKQAEALKTAQAHIENLRKISQNQAVADFAKIGGSRGDKILGAINQLAGAAASAISQATMVSALGGAMAAAGGAGGGQVLGGVATESNLLGGGASSASTTLLGSMPSDLTETTMPLDDGASSFGSLPSVPAFDPAELERLPKGGGGGGGGSSFGGSFSGGDISGRSSAYSGIAPSFFSDEPPSALAPPSTRLGGVGAIPQTTAAGSSSINFSRGGAGVSFDPMPELDGAAGGVGSSSDPLSRTINPFSGTGLRTEGVSRVQASRDAYQARSFYDFVESGKEFPFAGIGRPSAIRIEFAEKLRAEILRNTASGAGAARAAIDTDKLAEAIATYTRQSGGFIPTRANLSTLVDRISRFYFGL